MSNPHWSKNWALYASHLGAYMRRWILRTPWGTLRVHNVMKSDEGRDFHDHPFNFTSLILWGGYLEHRPGCEADSFDDYRWCRILAYGRACACTYYGPGSIVRRKAEDLHRLELINGHAWTFVVSSRYLRQWGFQLKDGSWVSHEEYHRSYYRS